MQSVIHQQSDREPIDLAGLGRDEFAAEVTRLGAKPFRAKQLWRWVYGHGVTDFTEMTNIAKPFRAALSTSHAIGRPEIAEEHVSADGTRKWLVRLAGGHEVETVFIPESDRGTLCISSQVGCTLSCRFCHTGTQRLVRNLTAAEIVGQLMLARDALDDWPSTREDRAVTNVVMMGMGEPLYNFDAVKAALHIFLDPEGISISRRRITLSTAGVVPLMQRCGEEIGVNLAVSLHAVTDAVRDQIVPLNRKFPIADLLAVCRTYPGTHNARRITFEYVMLRDVNDSAGDARELARLLGDIHAKINLIPFNPWPGAPYECSATETIARFADILSAAGLTATVRQPRGRDILAACGQLKSASERVPASARRRAAQSEARP